MDARTVKVDKVVKALTSFCQRNYGNKLTDEVIQGLFVMLNNFVFTETDSVNGGTDVSSDRKCQHGE